MFDICVVEEEEEEDMIVGKVVDKAVGMEVDNSVQSIVTEGNTVIGVIFYNSTSFLVLNIFYNIETNRNPF